MASHLTACLKSGMFELSMLLYSSAKLNKISEIHSSSLGSKTSFKLLEVWHQSSVA